MAVRKLVGTLLGLAIFAIAVGVVGAGQYDLTLRAGRPTLDLPRSTLLGIPEEEVDMERADMRLVADLRARFAGTVVNLDRAVVAGRVAPSGDADSPGPHQCGADHRDDGQPAQASGPMNPRSMYVSPQPCHRNLHLTPVQLRLEAGSGTETEAGSAHRF
jgi:hypothetical protein